MFEFQKIEKVHQNFIDISARRPKKLLISFSTLVEETFAKLKLCEKLKADNIIMWGWFQTA